MAAVTFPSCLLIFPRPSHMDSTLFLLALTLVLITSASSAPRSVLATPARCDFPAIFNFGDSNSDTGGLSAIYGQAPPPNGETFFHKPSGRFCDGRLVIDFMAEKLGLPYLRAYLDAVGSNFTNGANFATAGSTIRPQNTTFQQTGYSPVSLNVQFYEFNDFRRRSQAYRNLGGVFEQLLPKDGFFSRALYTFDIGQNDITAGYFLNMSGDQVRAYVPDLMAQFKNVVEQVYSLGGRSFWIHNTGPVGCLPYILERLPITAGQLNHLGCVGPVNDVAEYYNAKLKETVVDLRNQLPLAAITYVDVYSAKYRVISNAKKYGFVEPLVACCGAGGKYNYNMKVGCGWKGKVGDREIEAKSCEDPTVKINWDGYHYSEAANKLVFDQIVGGALSDPPVPLAMGCHRH